MDEYLNFVIEDYLVNIFSDKDDLYFNFDKFEKGQINKIFIIGMSGSGKSTLADKLAKKYNMNVVHTDMFKGNVHYSDRELEEYQPLIYTYFTNIWTYGDRHNIKIIDKELRNAEKKKFIYWLISLKDPIIIEGAIDEILIENDKLKKYPIICKNTSMMTSIIRMLKREYNRELRGRSRLDHLLWVLKWCTEYNKMRIEHNEARKKIFD